MKRGLAPTMVALLLGINTAARADAYDCFPMCPVPAPPREERPAKLCDVGIVREAAQVNERLKPVREVYEIATNPIGYAVKLVDEHVVHIPKWVGYVMDPKGAIKGAVIGRVRDEAKKHVGLENDCVAPEQISASEGDYE